MEGKIVMAQQLFDRAILGTFLKFSLKNYNLEACVLHVPTCMYLYC